MNIEQMNKEHGTDEYRSDHFLYFDIHYLFLLASNEY
jgi:hypothetical protein